MLTETKKAEVTLAAIPFVRLRDHLDEALLSDGDSYSQTVRRAQRSVDPPKLLLDSATWRVRMRNALAQGDRSNFAEAQAALSNSEQLASVLRELFNILLPD